MKNLYPFLLLAFFSFESNAQIVNIPDPAFKHFLVNTHCTDSNAGNYDINDDVDANNDGEIQVSEALAVTVLGFEFFDNINLSGIEAFSNLRQLNFWYFDHLNLDLSGVPSLEFLELHTGTLTSLNLSGLVNLKTFNTAFCNLPVTDFSGLANLESFGIWEGTIPSLDLSNLMHLKEINITGPTPTGTQLAFINLDGLTNLKTLTCSNVGLTNLDVSDLVNLTGLSCYRNQLTSLDLSNVNNLEGLECNDNPFTSLDVSNLTHLVSLNCSGNQLTSLDITNSPLLNYLYCYNNQLTELDLSNASNLYNLYCGQNQLTALNTTNLTKIQWIGVSSNLFTTLDFSYSLANHWSDLNFSNNPNLTYLNIKNGAGFSFHQYESFNVANCPNLRYICADESNFDDIDAPQAQISSYCSFTPSGSFNTISGTLTFDLNNNGCDAGDALSLNSKMKISTPFSNGVTFANASGNYSFFTQAGNFTVTPEFENPYFTVSPASANVYFETDANLTETRNFCITPNGIHNDVEITIIATQGPRPGFDTGYRLVYKNKGNQVLSGSINFTFDDAVLDFVSAYPQLASQTLNALNWNYENLLPFESQAIDFILNLNSPQETPAVNNGDVLNFEATINPVLGDDMMSDNTFSLSQTVMGSYDPNDKTCLEGATITPGKIGDYLHYVIRFQNSGTAAAENIVVKDVLDAEKFDVGSLQLLSSSHPYVPRITGNKIEFIFEGINLPAEQYDEPGSHGFVAFKIKTRSNLAIGSSVSNKADIYFDYNFPIATAPAVSTFNVLGMNEFEDISVAVYPNPVKNKLTIAAKNNVTSVTLFDIQGRMLQTVSGKSKKVNFDMSNHPTGIYFVKIKTEKGVQTTKIIKQ